MFAMGFAVHEKFSYCDEERHAQYVADQLAEASRQETMKV